MELRTLAHHCAGRTSHRCIQRIGRFKYVEILVTLRLTCALTLTWLALLAGSDAAAQTTSRPDVAAMTIQDLLDVEVVSTASKFPQEVREALRRSPS